MEESEHSLYPIRNPSPPPELQQNKLAASGDSIGGTSFSKHWLFTTLMRLIQEVDKETEAKEGVEGSSEFGVDVDEDLQTELCKLWDMSMNSDVAQFLQEFKAIDILTGVISRSQAPRVTEICVGILGNMACDRQVCEEISQNEKLVHLVLELLNSTDPPTLVETTRLLYASLSTKSVSRKWLEAITQAEGFKEQVAFLFQSSTNCDLLKNTADFVDTLFDVSDDLCATWASTELVDGLLEAIRQIGYKHRETLEVFLHIFQLLSTSQTGVQGLVERGEGVLVSLLHYLEGVCEDEIVGLEEHCACLSSVFSLLNTLFSSDPAIAEKLSTSAQLIRCMLKVLEPLHPILHPTDSKPDSSSHFAADSEKTDHASAKPVPQSPPESRDTEAGSKSANDAAVRTENGERDGEVNRAEMKDGEAAHASEMRQLRILFDVLQAFLRDFVSSLQVDRTEEEYGGTDDENFTSSNVPLFLPVLKYLDLACSRCRINYLALTLTDSTPSPTTKDKITSDDTNSATNADTTPSSQNTETCPSTKDKTTAENLQHESPSASNQSPSAASPSDNRTENPARETALGEVSLVVHLKHLCLMFGQMRVARILDDVMSGRIIKRTDSGGF